MTARQLDRAIEALARRQHGVFGRVQALSSGASSSSIDRRLAAGTWMRLASGVYALPGNPATFKRQCMASVLAEPIAWISGQSAAYLHRIEGFRPGRIELTVPSSGSHRNPFATIRRSSHFASTQVDGIPVGTIEQTVCDLACRRSTTGLEEILDDLLSRRRTTVGALGDLVASKPPGTQRRLGRLLAMLVVRSPAAFVPPSSVLERALYRVLSSPQLPVAVRQPAFPWRPEDSERADAMITEWRLIVEADGRAWHTRVADFARDRQRDRDAVAHGYGVVRFTYEELMHDPVGVLAELQRIGHARQAEAV